MQGPEGVISAGQGQGPAAVPDAPLVRACQQDNANLGPNEVSKDAIKDIGENVKEGLDTAAPGELVQRKCGAKSKSASSRSLITCGVVVLKGTKSCMHWQAAQSARHTHKGLETLGLEGVILVTALRHGHVNKGISRDWEWMISHLL